MKDEVSNRIGPLNVVLVRVERGEEGRVVGSDKVARGGVGPEMVGAVRRGEGEERERKKREGRRSASR